MTEQQVEIKGGTDVVGDDDCLLGLVEKVHDRGSGVYIEQLLGHTVDVDKVRGVATLLCFKCPVIVELTKGSEFTLENFQNIERCAIPEVRARTRLHTQPSEDLHSQE